MKASGSKDAYEVVLPQSRIVLSLISPPVVPDYLALELQNRDRVTVGSWEVSEPEPTGEADSDWNLLYDLYSEIHRTVAGWDMVLGDVKSALSQPGSIGFRRSENLPVRPVVDADDESRSF